MKLNELQIQPNDIFDVTNTDVPLYNDIMRSPEYQMYEKKRMGRVVYMHPDMYFEYLVQFGMGSRESHQQAVDPKLVQTYKERLTQSKMPLPVLEFSLYERNGRPSIDFMQEGRHRITVAKQLGAEQVPVLIIVPSNKEDRDSIIAGTQLEKDFADAPDINQQAISDYWFKKHGVRI